MEELGCAARSYPVLSDRGRFAGSFGASLIIGGECEMAVASSFGQRPFCGKLLARRLAVQKMHVRVQGLAPQLTPRAITIAKLANMQVLLCVESSAENRP